MMREQLLSEAIRGYQFRGKIPFAPDFIRLFRKRYCVEFFYAVSFLCLHKKCIIGEIHLSGCCELREMFFLQWVILCVKVLNVDGQKCIL